MPLLLPTRRLAKSATQKTSPWKITRAKASAVSRPAAAILTRNFRSQTLQARSSTNILHNKQPGASDVPVSATRPISMVSSSNSLAILQDRRVFPMFTTNELQTFSPALVSQTLAGVHVTQRFRTTTPRSVETISMASSSQTLAVRRHRRTHRTLPPNGVKLLTAAT